MSETKAPPPTNEAESQPTASFAASGQPTQDIHGDVQTPLPSSAVQVPGYRIEGVLGRGGMGVVYKAVQEKANRPVALKMILAGAHADQAEKTRFRAEAEAAGRLSHPSIVQLYEVGETPDGFPFFSLEFVAGGTLGERLKKSPLKSDEAAALVAALARAMQYAHERGIVHRDLKPANILLRDEGRETRGEGKAAETAKPFSVSLASHPSPLAPVPKISDFGLAKQLDTDDGLTRTGAIMGTPSYMAPEQAYGQSKNVGPAADIYALGAILYECLTGRPPFKAATVADTLEQVRTMEPITLKVYAKEIPADLETICLHCLHKEPQRRYASAEALADDLQRYLERKPISVRPVGAPERAWRWCRRNPGWAAVIATIALLLSSVTSVSLYAYTTVAAQNVVINKQNDDIKEEAKEKDRQHGLAVENEKKAVAARRDAEDRLVDSISSLKLVALDARELGKDALAPGESKKRFLEGLLAQLESQAALGDDKEFNEDKLRARIFLYESVSSTQMELARSIDAAKSLRKALKLADVWLAAKPNDPAALSRRAAVVHQLGTANENNLNYALAHKYYTEAYAARKKRLGNDIVERFTPGKTITDVADSLDGLKKWDEAIAFRVRAHAAVLKHVGTTKAKKDEAFLTLDALNWTYQKAAEATRELPKRKEYLDKANATSVELNKLRPGSRFALERWMKALTSSGELEMQLATRAQDAAQAKAHRAAAHEHYKELARLARQLAAAKEIHEYRAKFAAALYEQGRIEKEQGLHAVADEHLQRSLAICDELIRDVARDTESLKVDRLFPLFLLGRRDEALAEAETIAIKSPAKHTNHRLAIFYARSIAAIEQARRPAALTPDDKKLQAQCRDQALRCLTSAVSNGFDTWYDLRTNPDFDGFRDEPMFQRLFDKEKKK